MKYLTGLLIVFALGLLSSCIKHEIIPPPSPEVDLPASFIGSLNGATYEIIKDVDGYFCKATQAKELLPTPQLSTVTYYSSLQSESKIDFLQIGIGKLEFNADYNIDPSLEGFTSFFMDNMTQNFSAGAESGVEIVFRDSQGKIWISDPDLPNQFVFTDLSQESDEEGDYMKFTAKFSTVLSLDVDENDPDFGATIQFENGIFEGYFEK